LIQKAQLKLASLLLYLTQCRLDVLGLNFSQSPYPDGGSNLVYVGASYPFPAIKRSQKGLKSPSGIYI
jgi:hypothetical protein